MFSKRTKALEVELETTKDELKSTHDELEAMRVNRDHLREVADRISGRLRRTEEIVAALQDDVAAAQLRAEVAAAEAAAMIAEPKAAPGEQYVLVTIAQNGDKKVKHAWGPYPTRSKAQSLGQKFQREADRDGYKVERMVLKVIGDIDPKTGKELPR